MISEILHIWQNTAMTEQKSKYTCKYCDKQFSRETTLFTHMCEKKRRAHQEGELGVQWGYSAYLLFYEKTQLQGKSKTYTDFCDSPYYLAFVKFGRYCASVRCINYIDYTNWLLNNNKKIDIWASDKLYDVWLYQYLLSENVQNALDRGFKEMVSYAEENQDLKNGYMDYFRYGNSNRIIHHISSGRISPWLIYSCDSGINFLSSLSEQQISMIMYWIEPDQWNKKIKKQQSDHEWAKSILSVAGL